MSDITKDTGTQADVTKRVCRVAYTLNNEQPVRSTIIDDQPLFYMDYGCGIGEDDDEGMFFDTSDLGILESEIELLKREMDSLERLTKESARDPVRSLQEFRGDMDLVTAVTEQTAAAPSIEELKNILSQSRLARAYLEFMDSHGVKLEYSAQVQDATYERNSGVILIHPQLALPDRLLLAARELRHHWQHRQGTLINPLFFHPDNAILVNRMQTADLVVSMIRVAWELQLCGERSAWEKIENSSMADLGRAFAREAFLDFRTINNGQAGAAVLESWFLSERCRHEDRKLIKQMLADYRGYVFDHEEAQKNVTPALISGLGTMPYGKNYLAEHAPVILKDPVFTEVRDRSNANFLWFIKFERSFRETERDLQTPSASDAPGIRRKGASPQEEDYDNEAALPKTAEIVRIFPERENSGENTGDKSGKKGKILPPKSSVKRTKNRPGANVVYLRRWSGE